MPQEFNVMKCYYCSTFQVHIVKKSNKWCCKMCGEKQSVKKVYGLGTGKDCRLLVQSLNEKRMMNASLNESEHIINDFYNYDNQDAENSSNTAPEFEPSTTSKWMEYLANEYELYKYNLYSDEEIEQQISQKASKWSSFGTSQEDSANCEEINHNSDENNINSCNEIKQKISQTESKWNSSETNQDDSARTENTSVLKSTFDSTDMDSLDDILSFESL